MPHLLLVALKMYAATTQNAYKFRLPLVACGHWRRNDQYDAQNCGHASILMGKLEKILLQFK